MAWECPVCGKSFRNKNQWHSCYSVSLSDHLRNRSETIRDLVHHLISLVSSFGPVELNPVKSVIQIRTGATFLSIKPKKDHIVLEFQMDREIDMFPVHKTIRISGNRVWHQLYLQSMEDINDQLVNWLRDSYVLVRGKRNR